MKHLHAIKAQQEKGFNLLEIMVVMFIVGILAAISAPSLLGWYRRTQLDNAVNEVQGALLQAQQEAIRRSEECRVDDINSNTISSCVSTRTLPDTLTVSMTDGNTPIKFDFRGEVDEDYTISFSSQDVPDELCLRVFSPIGIIREGVMNNGVCEQT